MDSPELTESYSRDLQLFLAGGGEETLLRAMDLGRQALANGVGVLDIVMIHHRALVTALPTISQSDDPAGTMMLATQFFQECLSSYEITHRGFQEATTLMREVIQMGEVVCHELRTPLTSVMASGGMLAEVLVAPPGSRERRLMQNILEGAQALKARTDELADVVSLQAGVLSIRVVAVDTPALFARLAGQLGVVVEKAGMQLRMEVADDLPVIQADPGRVEQVVSNLVQNAIKYGVGGRRIDVRVSRAEDHLVIEVQDFGQGISVVNQRRLFQPYARVTPDSRTIPGMGIGLALCKQIVDAHRGQIAVLSDEGKGSTFRVLLPVDGPHAALRARA